MWFDDIASLGPGKEVVVDLPCPPNLANKVASLNHFRQHKEKKKYVETCLWEMKIQKIFEWRFDKAVWNAVVDVHQPYDSDNLVSLLKWPVDALRKHGLIVNDNWDHFWPLRWPSQFVDRKTKDRRVLFTITGWKT